MCRQPKYMQGRKKVESKLQADIVLRCNRKESAH